MDVKKQKLPWPNRGLTAWIVDGERVRDTYDIDFIGGGHDKVYEYIPDNEIWIDDATNPSELAFYLAHELFERALMSEGMEYEDAHERANAFEEEVRSAAPQDLTVYLEEAQKKNAVN